MSRWHLRVGDEVRTRIAIKDAAIQRRDPRTGKSHDIPGQTFGTIPKNTIGEVIDILGESPEGFEGEVCCYFAWADENGVVYDSVNTLNHQKWLERTPCFVGL